MNTRPGMSCLKQWHLITIWLFCCFFLFCFVALILYFWTTVKFEFLVILVRLIFRTPAETFCITGATPCAHCTGLRLTDVWLFPNSQIQTSLDVVFAKIWEWKNPSNFFWKALSGAGIDGGSVVPFGSPVCLPRALKIYIWWYLAHFEGFAFFPILIENISGWTKMIAMRLRCSKCICCIVNILIKRYRNIFAMPLPRCKCWYVWPKPIPSIVFIGNLWSVLVYRRNEATLYGALWGATPVTPGTRVRTSIVWNES